VHFRDPRFTAASGARACIRNASFTGEISGLEREEPAVATGNLAERGAGLSVTIEYVNETLYRPGGVAED
jgi:hypothetical protein